MLVKSVSTIPSVGRRPITWASVVSGDTTRSAVVLEADRTTPLAAKNYDLAKFVMAKMRARSVRVVWFVRCRDTADAMACVVGSSLPEKTAAAMESATRRMTKRVGMALTSLQSNRAFTIRSRGRAALATVDVGAGCKKSAVAQKEALAGLLDAPTLSLTTLVTTH